MVGMLERSRLYQAALEHWRRACDRFGEDSDEAVQARADERAEYARLWGAWAEAR